MGHKNKHSIKQKTFQRFNKNPDDSDFLEHYQKVMIERLLLNRNKKYHKINVDRIITRVSDRKPKHFDTSVTRGVFLSSNVETDFYVLLQELLFEMTGDYYPMDEFIHLLLTWFYHKYRGDINGSKNIKNLPFTRLGISHRNNNVNKFNKRFSKFYKNHKITLKNLD